MTRKSGTFLSGILTIFDNLDNFWPFWQILIILTIFTILTILTFFLQFWQFLTIFDNWRQFSQFRQFLLSFWQLKRQSWRLVTFETLITILTIENLNSWQSCYLTINCDTEQHLQFLRCFSTLSAKPNWNIETGLVWYGENGKKLSVLNRPAQPCNDTQDHPNKYQYQSFSHDGV